VLCHVGRRGVILKSFPFFKHGASGDPEELIKSFNVEREKAVHDLEGD
jgi:hypothetical protein